MPNGIHPRVLKLVAEAIAKPMPIVYQQSWLHQEVPAGWSTENITSIYKKGTEEDLRNHRLPA